MSRRPLTVLLVVVGLLLIAVAVIYFTVPIKSLPSFIPGHVSGLGGHRPKRGVAAAVVGVACLVIAYIQATRAPRSGEAP